MTELFQQQVTTPSGMALVHGDASHLAALTAIASCVLALFLGRRVLAARARPALRYAMAAALIANELAWHAFVWRTGNWSIETMLPLHVCSAVIWLSAIMLVTRSYRLYEVVYLVGVAGALQALLTPATGEYGFPHFRYFQFFISHGGIVVVAAYMTSAEGFRPEPRSLLRVTAAMLGYAALVGAINAALGSNYLFIAHKPPQSTALDLLPPWPWYIAPMVLGFFASMALLDLPFRVLRRRPSPPR